MAAEEKSHEHGGDHAAEHSDHAEKHPDHGAAHSEHAAEHSEHAAPYEDIRGSIRASREENQRIYGILHEIMTRKRTFKDEKDESAHPSYTDFKVPYHMTCRIRYSKKKEEYEEQFQYELNEMLNHQPTAYDAARFNRHLCITTLWPPLHNRSEIEYFQNYFFRLSHKQKKRLQYLMNSEIN